MKAIEYAIATLVISCPCAIGLAVPMVVVIAIGVAAKNGIIFKSSQAVETARNIPREKALVNGVVFDSISANYTQTYTCIGRDSILTITKL